MWARSLFFPGSITYTEHGFFSVLGAAEVAELSESIQRKGILLLQSKALHRGWPARNDFTCHLYTTPSSVYPQLAAMTPDIPVRIFDGLFDRKTSYSEYIRLLQSYPVIGMSVVSSVVALNNEINLRLIRKHNPDAVVIMGGHHPTFYAEQWLERGVDVVVRHEGEESYRQVVQVLIDGGRLDEVTGISFRRADGEIVHNPDRPFLKNLDDLPLPNWRPVDFSLYNRFLKSDGYTATVETARGCPFHCTFCCIPTMWKATQRHKSAERVLAEIDQLHELGVRQIAFADDCFGTKIERDMQIFEGVLGRGYDMAFCGFVRPDAIYHHPELIELAARAGWNLALIGFESVYENVLERYNKNLTDGMTATHYQEIYRRLKKHGIFVYGLFVFDFDAEIEQSWNRKTWRRIEDISDFTGHSRFIPMRGVPAIEEMVEKGYHFRDMFYHERHIPTYQFKGTTQKALFAIMQIYDILRPANLVKMLFGNFVEKAFFRALYRGLLIDMLHISWKDVRAFLISRNKKLKPEEIQQAIVDAYLNAFKVNPKNQD